MPTPPHRARRTATAAALLTALTAMMLACTGPSPSPAGAAPSAAPVTSTTTATTTPSRPAATPTSVAVSEEPDVQAATAAGAEFFDVFATALNDGDSTDLRRWAAPGCAWCESVAQQVDDLALADDSTGTGAATVARHRFDAITARGGREAAGKYVVEVGADHVVTTIWEESPGAHQLHIGAPERLVLALALTQRDDGWQVDGVRVVEGG
ncbi:hypothetical protein [Cellulomonas sp. FA1]|jgi:hypothetical protein|uniref:hypothetical protein n=1 Tax=Cellulomonas sp. FA1 TaxID=1346710 RepID=UPI000A40D56D|nr:hypothetical protein [Cellulomonas sp. FA1]